MRTYFFDHPFTEPSIWVIGPTQRRLGGDNYINRAASLPSASFDQLVLAMVFYDNRWGRIDLVAGKQ